MRNDNVRIRRLAGSALCAVAVCCGILGSVAPPAGAAGGTTTTVHPTCSDPNKQSKFKVSTDLMPGVTIGPAIVLTPGKPNRKLNADQATAFIQSWLPASVYTKIPPTGPPVGVPVSHLYMYTSFNRGFTCIEAWYASRGTNAWVGMPAQSLGWASVQQDVWIAAPLPARTIAAFLGKIKPIITNPSTTGAPTTTTVPSDKKAAGKSSGSSSSSSWLLLLIPGVLVLGAGAFLIVRGRNRASTAEV